MSGPGGRSVGHAPARVFSVVLPTYNRCDVVEETLRRLVAVDYPDDGYEILVADNSSDGTPAMVERMAAASPVRIRLLASDERLPAVKRNQGLRAAEGELMVFLNDDLWVRPDFLAEHERTHRAHPGPVAVVGHCEQSPAMPHTPFVAWYQPFSYDEIADRAGARVSWRHFWSMNLSLPRRTMLDRNLVFHQDWAEIGSEDVELGWRWTRAGLPVIYHPAASGEHYHPHTLDSACRLQASVGRGLRDLERLVADPTLLERYGVLSPRNRPRALLRGLARTALFNPVTVPPVQRWLGRPTTTGPLARWMYWKVLLHHTNAGYRAAPRRSPVPLVTR